MAGMSRLEQRWGRWAIPNLTAAIIVAQAAFYVMKMMRGPEFSMVAYDKMALKPQAVMNGEVWRLASFVVMPPLSRPLFAILQWIVFHLIGSSLERLWGVARFNSFLAIGYLANVAAAFLAWWIWDLASPVQSQAAPLSESLGHATNALLFGSLFFAYARRFPDTIFNLFFVLPIRVKWLGLLAWIGWFYGLLRFGGPSRLLLIASVANYLVFFGREHWNELRQVRRRRAFEGSVQRSKPRHQCRVCGLNSHDSQRTLFRYCSQCTGQKCYCPEHIGAHRHE